MTNQRWSPSSYREIIWERQKECVEVKLYEKTVIDYRAVKR